jgi:hypothetical protein
MNKKLSLIMAAGLAVATMFTTSCSKTKVEPVQQNLNPTCGGTTTTTYGLDYSRLTSSAPTITACGTKTVSIESGSTTLGSVTISNTADSIYIVMTGTDGWKWKEADIYVGILSNLPLSNSITPNLSRFTIQHNFSSSYSVLTYAFAASTLPDSFIIVLHPTAKKLISSSSCYGSTYSTKIGWAEGTSFGTPTCGSPAYYVSFTKGSCAGSGSGGGGGSGSGGGDNKAGGGI